MKVLLGMILSHVVTMGWWALYAALIVVIIIFDELGIH